jgi:methylated-DNA-[protein]-cysteine S-methyltransferase
MSRTIAIAEIESPVGDLTMVLDGEAVCALLFDEIPNAPGDGRSGLARRLATLEARLGAPRETWKAAPRGATAIRRLRDYFRGDLRALDEIEVAPSGTPFQLAVWRALRRIPAGSTKSYGEIAREIRLPDAVRAVGAANGANPICIIVPCHRVIGANGTLTGYGGGLDRKRWLLAHESLQPPLHLSPSA